VSEAAPAAGAAADAGAAAGAEEKKSLLHRLLSLLQRLLTTLRRHLPKLVVAVVGIALTAWLFPALTRQWDDRQKASELKAALVAQMSSDSGNALIGGQDILLSRRNRTGLPEIRKEPTPERQWAIASSAIGAQIHAYFPSGILEAWKAYTILVDSALERMVYRPGFAQYFTISHAEPGIPDAQLPQWFAFARHKYARLNTHKLFQSPIQLNPRKFFQYRLGVLKQYQRVERHLFVMQRLITAHLLAANPTGYSVTFGDLLHDLRSP
jgi:hypothetical protein